MDYIVNLLPIRSLCSVFATFPHSQPAFASPQLTFALIGSTGAIFLSFPMLYSIHF